MAQPVLEHSYEESATLISLEHLGEIYYSMDVVNKRCLVYSMDHVQMKSIPLPTSEGYYLADIQLVSENLFNEDDLLELVYIASRYNVSDGSYYYSYEARLINENGNTLLDLPGVGYCEVLPSSEGNKFLTYRYDYSVIPYRTYTQVYSLGGGSQVSSRDMPSLESANAYPNPARGQITIPVELPEGVSKASLVITDMHGRQMLTYPLNRDSEMVLLPAATIPPGTYVYQIDAGAQSPEARKFIIR
jgi:hypothetical protein